MQIRKNLHRAIALLIVLNSLMLTSNIILNDFPIFSIAYAEVKTYIGVDDYILSDDVPPGDIKSKAKFYAQCNALEKWHDY